MKRIELVLAIAGVLLFTSMAFAQKFGKITGTVIDGETGEGLPGANVIVVGTTLGAASNLEGSYAILRVPPGTYEVRTSFMGYQTVVTQNVEVLTDLTTEVNFTLQPETVAAAEEVVVTAERPIVRKDLTSAEARVQSKEIQRLPVQELGDILNLQAGVTRDADGGIHIRGGRSTEIAYMVNGVRITDDFTRTQAIEVENESIQELQVISGTFNAEYGEALSGVINIVTKTGGNVFRGNFEAWSGDYISDNDGIFFNIDDTDPTANYNLQGSLSGPIIKDNLTFFVTGRRWKNGGWLFGANAFDPQGRLQVIDGDTVQVRGDSSAVSMNFRDRWSGQASIEWRIAGPLKLKIDALGSKEDRGTYNHDFRLNPLGDRSDEVSGFTLMGNLTHALGSKTFYELTGSYKENDLTAVLFDDPFDLRYVHPDSLETGANQFIKAGTDLARFERRTKTWIGKFDVTSQISERHQVKSGVELKFDEVFLEDLNLVPREDESGQQIVPFVPEIRPVSEPTHERIKRNPFTFAAYIQDKIEYESLIINIGLRFDLFDARAQVPVDLTDPNIFNPFKLENTFTDANGDGVISLDEQTEDNELTVAEREAMGWYRDTSIKTQFSPRLGIAYPITDRGVIHFSFGIFQQIPDYEQLYRGDQLKVTSASGIQGGNSDGFGNPDLDPQKTTMYELGLQQQLTENLGADVTLFFRDIRDWVSSSQPIDAAIAGVSYVRRINRDFAEVLGVTLTLNRRFANHFSFNLDYTFQVAEGTNSSPDEEFFAQQDGDEPTKQLTPLDWDQTHSLNASLFVGSNDWGISLIERFNSGQPFSPEISTFGRTGRNIIGGLEKNSRNKPDRLTVDLTAFKTYNLADFRVKFFARVFNLFDSKNPVDIFADTGEADFTFDQLQAVSADPTYFVRPDFYSEPRRIQVGASFGF
ncbi:TonB-dependent receptor [candidate division KSB1 bacterium]|nr:TonB-dependent receptor [candidate division KSB1 bacterium]NIR72098.1 TonB-dependent receptor [candidate division KSB1 bacterium]NIS23158.1 TonB-dependent receptor [candidate division KSB1 bacterium]NIT70465.1 TonB-dependent receptor [candidate division KSB1 bacterium]NIU24163.1 TonB-dependent receptor [candidate division KSB1 bacterium]